MHVGQSLVSAELYVINVIHHALVILVALGNMLILHVIYMYIVHVSCTSESLIVHVHVHVYHALPFIIH